VEKVSNTFELYRNFILYMYERDDFEQLDVYELNYSLFYN